MSQVFVPTSANDLVERELNSLLESLEQGFGADALCIVGQLVDGIDDFIRLAIEERRARRDSTARLAVILTTDGGFLETVQRIVDTMRRHYPDHVVFIIPDRAFSAGTILAMSGDEIYMDYYSRLGPIDPQARNPRTGRLVPALGYVERYKELLKKLDDGKATSAEALLLFDYFDQAELHQHEQAKKLAEQLISDWLTRYKFKDWTKRKSSGRIVDAKARKARAGAVARKLSNTQRWRVHGHGISMEVLRKELDLKIEDLDDNPARANLLKEYNSLISDYMTKMQYPGILHTVGNLEKVRFVT